MKIFDPDEGEHPPPRRFYIQEERWRDRSTAPLLKGEGDETWEGRVVVEGATPDRNRWFLVRFEGFGIPFSAKRREEVSVAYIEMDERRQARVALLVLRYKSKTKFVGRPTAALRYGWYFVNAMASAQMQMPGMAPVENKWQLVQQTIERSLLMFAKRPGRGVVIVQFGSNVEGQETLPYNLDWLNDEVFPEMDRSLKGLDE